MAVFQATSAPAHLKNAVDSDAPASASSMYGAAVGEVGRGLSPYHSLEATYDQISEVQRELACLLDAQTKTKSTIATIAMFHAMQRSISKGTVLTRFVAPSPS